MRITTLLAALLSLPLMAAASSRTGNHQPATNVDAQPVAGDPTSLDLSWNDGVINGFAGPDLVHHHEIRISTTMWGADIDDWFDTVAQPASAVIPAPVNPPGSLQQTTIGGLTGDTTYYLAVRAYFDDTTWIPIDTESGIATATTDPASSPSPTPTPGPAAQGSSSDRQGCSAGAAVPVLALLALAVLLRASR